MNNQNERPFPKPYGAGQNDRYGGAQRPLNVRLSPGTGLTRRSGGDVILEAPKPITPNSVLLYSSGSPQSTARKTTNLSTTSTSTTVSRQSKVRANSTGQKRIQMGAKRQELIHLTESSLQQLKTERLNALWSISTGVYIVWRGLKDDTSRNKIRLDDFNPNITDCIRLGPYSGCLCDHPMASHMPMSFASAPLEPMPHTSPTGLPRSFKLSHCSEPGCPCKCYTFVPTFPEEIGEGWLSRRPGFDLTVYRPKCTCGHTTVEHEPTGWNRCRNRACRCNGWEAHYQCAACDGLARDHEVVIEGEDDRVRAGRSVGEYYIPFEEIRGLVKGFR